jgi:protein-tyrosine phosphatase
MVGNNSLNGKEMIRVLFVCMGNICRSPTAEGVFGNLVERYQASGAVLFDSAGTHAYHIGERPDPRAQEAARRRGIDIGRQAARRVEDRDFERFDYIVAMDRDNLASLESRCPTEHRQKLALMLRYAPHLELDEVPDPYYGGPQGFERVLDLIEAAAEGLLQEILARQGGGRQSADADS